MSLSPWYLNCAMQLLLSPVIVRPVSNLSLCVGSVEKASRTTAGDREYSTRCELRAWPSPGDVHSITTDDLRIAAFCMVREDKSGQILGQHCPHPCFWEQLRSHRGGLITKKHGERKFELLIGPPYSPKDPYTVSRVSKLDSVAVLKPYGKFAVSPLT